MAAMLTVLAAVGFMLIYAENVFDYQRCPTRHWLGTSLLLSLCVVSMTYGAARTSRLNIVFAALALSIAVGTYLGIPSKDHAFRGGTMAPNALVLWAFLAIPIELSAACLTNFVVSRYLQFGIANLRPHWKRALVVGSGFLTVAVILASAVLASPILTGGNGDRVPRWQAIVGWIICATVAASALWAWILRDQFQGSTAAWAKTTGGLTRFSASLLTMLLACRVVGAGGYLCRPG